MINDLKLNTNSNLIKNIFSFLTPKDQSQSMQANKNYYKIAKSFNNYWRDASFKYFFTDGQHYSIVNSKDYALERVKTCDTDSITSTIDWKKFFQIGVVVKNNWTEYQKNNTKVVDFNKDIIDVQNEVYSILNGKISIFNNSLEYYSLPKLRKENMYLESDLNSTLQIHMYDFLYDQQDLYDYYCNEFEEKENNQLYSIIPRNSDLPFAKALGDFDIILNDFFEEKHKDILAGYRWYTYGSNANFQEQIK